MSYCRHSFYRSEDEEDKAQSDVYMYEHIDDFTECCGCLLSSLPNRDQGCVSVQFMSKRGALAHLWQHRLAGHIVPQYAFDRLEEEIGDEEWEESKRRNKEFHDQVKLMKEDVFDVKVMTNGEVVVERPEPFRDLQTAQQQARALVSLLDGKILFGD